MLVSKDGADEEETLNYHQRRLQRLALKAKACRRDSARKMAPPNEFKACIDSKLLIFKLSKFIFFFKKVPRW